MRKGYLALVAAALALLASTVVRADIPVNIAYMGVAPSRAVTLHSATPSPLYDNVLAGSYNHFVPYGTDFIVRGDIQVQGVPDGPDSVSGVTRMFCLDLASSVEPNNGYTNTALYYLTDPANAPMPDGGPYGDGSGVEGANSFPMGADRADWLAVLAARYWTDYLDGGTAPVGHTDPTGTQRGDRYAALQVAIWEIVYEGEDDEDLPTEWSVYNGNFSDFYVSNARLAETGAATPQVLALAETMLDWCSANYNDETDRQFLGALTSDEWQDMLVVTSSKVPEPSALALAGLGLLGFFTRRRKRS
jgi:hypothetical protein